ncbi:hypothetical protein ACFOG5_10995 [Pedobacter fastidiosus]|uniref:PD-(D/E)XK nuclease superfamily protein n=1 Tax=Pedobacter fastidiosus TaxID=2765361 RepID=A0ABR7KW64_9SPHI|nr:hypothetical protein [Pedobacter fastidiosus]MBC6112354.1 hypothetical protein [Pedobacter fastidiosus]
MTDFYEDFKPVRNRIRRLNIFSSLNILFSTMRSKKLAIIPEAAEFLYIHILMYAEAPITPKNEIEIWNKILPELYQFKDRITAAQIDKDVWRWMHTMGLNQLKASHNYYFNLVFRYYTIFADPKIAEHIEERLGLSYKSYFVCGLWLHSVFLEKLTYPKTHFTRKDHGGEMALVHMHRTLELLTIPLEKLKSDLKASVTYDDDIFITQGYPHVTHPVFENGGLLYCMYPDYLIFQLTAGTYYLADIGNNEHQLAKAFGDGFERYVGIILDKVNAQYHFSVKPETVYQLNRKQGQLRSSDWIIETDEAIVFIECKTKKLRLSSKNFTKYQETLNEDLQHMVNAAVQLYKVYQHYSDDRIPGLPYVPDKKFVPLVVTLEDWFAGGPDTDKVIQERIEAAFIEKGLDTSLLKKYPFKSYSVNQLELDIQLMFSCGFVEYFRRLHKGEISTEDRKSFPYIDYFEEEYEREFIAPLR